MTKSKHKYAKSKSRNKARKLFRQEHPEHRGKHLKKLPFERNI